MKILVIGESCLDVFIYGKVERLEPSAPVPVFSVVKSKTNPGMAMNVVENLKSLGAEVDFITNEGWENITKTRYVEQKSNHMFLRVDSNEETIKNTFKLPSNMTDYDCVVISDYNKSFLTEKDIVDISQNHSLVFLDTKKPLTPSLCEDIDFIKINHVELSKAKKITGTMKNKLIATQGSNGALFRDELFPVPEVQIKDLSGSGDTFLSGLVVEYLKTKDIRKAIIFANECATKVVQKAGVSVI